MEVRLLERHLGVLSRLLGLPLPLLLQQVVVPGVALALGEGVLLHLLGAILPRLLLSPWVPEDPWGTR